jgi:hypothetical protein
MSFFKRLAGLLGNPGARSGSPFYHFSVRCNRCGEVIEARVNLNNDLSPEFGEGEGGPQTYVCRKGLIGSGRCFQSIEVTLQFDARRKLTDRQIVGGTFVD